MQAASKLILAAVTVGGYGLADLEQGVELHSDVRWQPDDGAIIQHHALGLSAWRDQDDLDLALHLQRFEVHPAQVGR